MARRVLSLSAGFIALWALSLSSCRRGDHEPAATTDSTAARASAARAAASSYVQSAREGHLAVELERAQGSWRERPALGDCSATLHEKADSSLCQAAEGALLAVEREPSAPPERALPLLADAALSLARLAERLRFLSLAELSRKQATTSASGSASTVLSAARAHVEPAPGSLPASPKEAHGSFQISEGPTSRMMNVVVRLEHVSLRNIGAYLEYATLPVRRSAFATVKRLHGEHPQWPTLDHLLREASLLESDVDLKRELHEVAPSQAPKARSE